MTLALQEPAGWYYYVSDHLGSVRAVVDEAGAVVSYSDYYPFGLQMPSRTLSGAAKASENYTGHELDAEPGLLYAGARYYMPEIARWGSVDPMGDHPMQRDKSPYAYAYAWNNPMLWDDPDGRCIPLCLVAAWAVVEAGLATYDAYDVYSTVTDPNASDLAKGVSIGGAALGLLLPGGGYSATDDVIEFGGKFRNAEEYARGAQNFFKREGDEIIQYSRGNGDIVKYDFFRAAKSLMNEMRK